MLESHRLAPQYVPWLCILPLLRPFHSSVHLLRRVVVIMCDDDSTPGRLQCYEEFSAYMGFPAKRWHHGMKCTLDMVGCIGVAQPLGSSKHDTWWFSFFYIRYSSSLVRFKDWLLVGGERLNV